MRAEYFHRESLSLVIMIIFKAKADAWLVSVLVAGVIGCTIPMVYMAMMETEGLYTLIRWAAALLVLMLTWGCTHMILNTLYVIDHGELFIQSGFLYSKVIDIASIRKIEATRTPISAPAPSLDRLEIFYGRFDSVIVSPKDKDAFIKRLLRENPDIEVRT